MSSPSTSPRARENAKSKHLPRDDSKAAKKTDRRTTRDADKVSWAQFLSETAQPTEKEKVPWKRLLHETAGGEDNGGKVQVRDANARSGAGGELGGTDTEKRDEGGK